jgi:hypothetical protein
MRIWNNDINSSRPQIHLNLRRNPDVSCTSNPRLAWQKHVYPTKKILKGTNVTCCDIYEITLKIFLKHNVCIQIVLMKGSQV